MARSRNLYVCDQCGHQSPRWLGKCPECGEWNTLVETVQTTSSSSTAPISTTAPQVIPIGQVSLADCARVPTGSSELDRVLGGGLVPGSLVLVGGDPGIGKSTLLLQTCQQVAAAGRTVLYATGEESAQQVRLRAERLGALEPRLLLIADNDQDRLEAAVSQSSPQLVIVDSIQTVFDAALDSAPGTVGQVRNCGARWMRLAKDRQVTVILVGHVTKEGTLAGPRVLEHLVDAVLYFEGDRFQSFRILRAVKNRFGSTDEIGLFEMSDAGLRQVGGASEMLLSGRAESAPGSMVAAVMEGSRPVLVEIQALVARSYLTNPRRTVTGLEPQRAAMLLAVLERRCGVRLGDKDVFLNVAGGLRVVEPAADLAIALAVYGSYRGQATPHRLAACGEVGLGGELRAVSQLDRRLRELERLGFKECLSPDGPVVARSGSQTDNGTLVAKPCRDLATALKFAFPDGRSAAGSDPEDPFES